MILAQTSESAVRYVIIACASVFFFSLVARTQRRQRQRQLRRIILQNSIIYIIYLRTVCTVCYVHAVLYSIRVSLFFCVRNAKRPIATERLVVLLSNILKRSRCAHVLFYISYTRNNDNDNDDDGQRRRRYEEYDNERRINTRFSNNLNGCARIAHLQAAIRINVVVFLLDVCRRWWQRRRRRRRRQCLCILYLINSRLFLFFQRSRLFISSYFYCFYFIAFIRWLVVFVSLVRSFVCSSALLAHTSTHLHARLYIWRACVCVHTKRCGIGMRGISRGTINWLRVVPPDTFITDSFILFFFVLRLFFVSVDIVSAHLYRRHSSIYLHSMCNVCCAVCEWRARVCVCVCINWVLGVGT